MARRRRVIESDSSEEINLERPSREGPELSFGIEIESYLLWHRSRRTRRGTEDEPEWPEFKIALRLIKDSGLAVDYQEVPMRQYQNDHSIWRLDEEVSLSELSDEQTGQAFRARQREARDTDRELFGKFESWEPGKLEFISPKYDDFDLARGEVENLLNRLIIRTSFTMVNVQCGLHVHVGLTNGQCIPLKALQCLAFATVVFEEQLDKLHPLRRCEGNSNTKSNQLAFHTVAKTKGTKMIAGTYGSRRHIRIQSVPSIRDEIFKRRNRAQLERLIGNERYSRVSFEHISDRHGLRTVEFRQHAGSLDATEIMHWVVFCNALVRWEYRLAEHGESCLPEIDRWSSSGLNIMRLLGMLDLPEDTKSFYIAKLRLMRITRAMASELVQSSHRT